MAVRGARGWEGAGLEGVGVEGGGLGGGALGVWGLGVGGVGWRVAGDGWCGTVGLEQLDTARLGTVDGGGAERAVVVMHAAAAQCDGLAWSGLG